MLKKAHINGLRAFYRKHPVVTYSKGETILQQNEVPRHILAIKHGVVKVSNLTSEGVNQSISFKIVDDILPLYWAFSKSTKTLFYYEAYTNCELYVIDKDEFQQQLNTDIHFVNELLRRQVNSYVGSMLQVDALEKTRAYTKLAYTFRYLCLRYGRETRPDFVKIYVPLTQQELANTTGLTRETTTLELKKLRKKRIISSIHKYYTVNTAKLNKEIDDEYNPGVEVSMHTKLT